MGTQWRHQPIRGQRGEVLTNQRAECIDGNYGWISDNIPSYPPLSNTNIVWWTVVKLLRLPRSLGHLASINWAVSTSQAAEMNGQ